MKVVFDTNVFIAAALRGGFAEDLIELSTKGEINLIISEEILTEIKQKLLTKFDRTEERVNFFIERIRKSAKVVAIKERVLAVRRDPEDNKIIECAIAGKADIIVTSDQDLIKIKVFRGIAIIHPKTLAYTFPRYFKKK